MGGRSRHRLARSEGEIDVGGPDLAHSLAAPRLIDEYRICLHPVGLGLGVPFVKGPLPLPPLRLLASDRIGEGVIRLCHVRA